MPDLREIEYEVWVHEECVATTCGAYAEDEAVNYARAYEVDNPDEVFVYEVTKTRELVR